MRQITNGARRWCCQVCVAPEGISAVQDMCVCVCAAGTLIRRLERGSHLRRAVRGCRRMIWAAPKRCDGFSDAAYGTC